jgi:hypothetical protein
MGFTVAAGLSEHQSTVDVREILPALGFLEVWGVMTERQPAFAFKSGNIDITAAEVMSLFLRREFSFGGVGTTGRSIRSIQFSMPLEVESVEQGVAWLVHGIGADFVPSEPIEWFEAGKSLKHLLPWEQQREMRLAELNEFNRRRQARPHCKVARSLVRSIFNHLGLVTAAVDIPIEYTITFNGCELAVSVPRARVGVPAAGSAAWPLEYRGDVATLLSLAKRRFNSDPVEVGVWAGALEFDRHSAGAVRAVDASAR